MRLPPVLQEVDLVTDTDRAMTLLRSKLTFFDLEEDDITSLCNLLMSDDAMLAVSRVTDELVLGLRRHDSPLRQRWFTVGREGLDRDNNWNL